MKTNFTCLWFVWDRVQRILATTFSSLYMFVYMACVYEFNDTIAGVVVE